MTETSRPGLFARLRQGLARTRERLGGGIADLLLGRRTYDIFAAYWPYVGGEATGLDAPFRLSPKDGRKIVFGGVALRVFGDPGDAYYAEVARHMGAQSRLCSVLRARCAARGKVRLANASLR